MGGQPIIAKNNTYVALFFITLSTLMHELVLMRIFSATTWYHFAFVAVSVAMFGLTVGAIIVYLRPGYFTNERVHYHLAQSSLFFALWIVLSFLIYVKFPFLPQRSIGGVLSIGFVYTVLTIPFIFAGICVCLVLTRFPHQISKLYAVDLLGAAIGCILLIVLLDILDGPSAVLVIAFLASIGGILFSFTENFVRLRRSAIYSSLLILCLAIVNSALAFKQLPLIRLKQLGGRFVQTPNYEKWNSFSRIQVFEEFTGTGPKRGDLVIDSLANTSLLPFPGDSEQRKSLERLPTNFVHYLRHDAKILIIGSGGGQDIVSSLLFNQKSVVAVELNQDILKTVNKRYGDFTGHLDRHPKVAFVNDEARSYLTRIDDKFDIIQITFIDTFAATAAGAFVLTENSLYTVEAWKIFLQHLTPNGVLTLTTHYLAEGFPATAYRLTSLAAAALKELRVEDPRRNIVIIKGGHVLGKKNLQATILVTKDPFSAQDQDTIERVARDKQFTIVLSPWFSENSIFAALSSGKNLQKVAAGLPFNVAPPTDNSPFFFHVLRLRDIFKVKLGSQGILSFNMTAVFILAVLLLVIVGLTVLCILVPIIRKTDRRLIKRSVPISFFFCGIGLGFILIELSQMQRLMLFLGHPTYSLSVVIFALLLSGGLGSFLTQKINTSWMMLQSLFFLLCLLSIFGFLTPHAIRSFQGSSTEVRILVAIGLLFPIGLFMGMPFPLGMRTATARSPSLAPWLWGINGATSVCASVLSTAIALNFGISAGFWTGFWCYTIAFTVFPWMLLVHPVVSKAQV